MAHVAWGAVALSALANIWAAAVTRRRDTSVSASVVFLLVQGVALVIGRGNCPFGPFQRRLGDPVPMFELALPPRAAKAAIPVLLVASLAGMVAWLLRSRARSWSITSIRTADLTSAQVFDLYTDPSTWSSWGHNTRAAHASEPLREGSSVLVQAGYRRTWEVLVRRLEPDRLIETEVHPPGLDIIQRFEVLPAQAGVRIRHEIEVSGWAAGFTGLTLRPFYRRWLDWETAQLIDVARRRLD
jgi:hypothetical protein